MRLTFFKRRKQLTTAGSVNFRETLRAPKHSGGTTAGAPEPHAAPASTAGVATVAGPDATASTSAAGPVAAERTHAEIMVIFTALMMAMLLAALDQSIVSTALPKIASDLNGLNKLSWVASAYLLTSAVVTPIYGKLGDLFGRKKIFQISIIIFLVGSALCGLSQSMNQLVFFRALQGLGGGGLMSLAFAIVGDIVPPRQRGRYQGYFVGVFGLATVAGPLLGGLFTDFLSWRWIFYINLPLGLVALSAVAARLHLPVLRRGHDIDYSGAALLSVAVVSTLLVSIWAGVTYAWGSTTILGLVALGIVSSIAFVVREHYAPEPMIPLRLFKNDIFSVSVIISLLSGITMFAAILYIPEYQQIVHGYSPTKSGLLMLPLVAGLFVASIVSGRLTTRTGRYRIFPIVGTLVIAVGLWLFSHLGTDTSQIALSAWMVILGAGIGLFMQIPTLAVQNTVDRADLGTGTSTVSFFRSLGSAFGGAVIGTILNARITHHLTALLPATAASAHFARAGLQAGAAGIAKAPAAIRTDILEAFVRSFHDIFLIGIPFALATFVAALFLRNAPLRESTADMAEGASLDLTADPETHPAR